MCGCVGYTDDPCPDGWTNLDAAMGIRYLIKVLIGHTWRTRWNNLCSAAAMRAVSTVTAPACFPCFSCSDLFVCATAGRRRTWTLLVVSWVSTRATSASYRGLEMIPRSCCFIGRPALALRTIWCTVQAVPAFALALASAVSECWK